MPWRNKERLEVRLHSLLTSALGAAEWLPSQPGDICAEEEPWYTFSKRFGDPKRRSEYFG